MNTCPICKQSNLRVLEKNEMCHVECDICKSYIIDRDDAEDIYQDDKLDKVRYILSGAVRQESDYGTPITVKYKNVKDIIGAALMPENALEGMDRILFYIDRKAKNAASYVTIEKGTDYPVAYTQNMEEFGCLLQRIKELKYVENANPRRYRLSVEGLKHLISIKEQKVESDQAFVAMSFDSKMDTLYFSGIKKALEATNYKPKRMKEYEHNGLIDDQIMLQIKKSGLLVADFTGNCENVYYEAGYAKGLGINVVHTCRKDYIEKKKLKFDVEHICFVGWESPDELKEKLIARIEYSIRNLPKRRFIYR